jgi:ABC-type antimicrobial peptide transport system permease subunit
MGVPPRAGRAFAEMDREGAAPAVIVNDSFVKSAWPGQDALGKHLRLLGEADQPRGEPLPPGPWLTVVGVVPDILQDDESFEVSPVIYLPFRQRAQGGMEIVVRTRVPPATLGDAIRREVQAIDEDMAVRALRPLEESFWLRNWRYRIFGTMFAIFAGIALVLASLGLYAVMAQSVSQRTREIGLRMTLGATRRNIFGLVFRQGMLRLAIGLAIGLAGSFWATSGLESMLVGVSPADPTTFAAVATVLMMAGVLGCAVPASRAVRVDPLVALRKE